MSDSANFDDFDRVLSQRDLSRAIGWKRLSSWDSGTRTLRAVFEVRPEFCHSGGTIAQGGFVTAWLDASMAQATMRDTNFESNIATLELKVSFLKAVPPGDVLAEGRVLRRGRRVVFLEASLFNADGTELLATASSTGLIVPLVLDKE
ncbi:MAG: PaaI family thioesterase [Burkholderiaceae bacterium]